MAQSEPQAWEGALRKMDWREDGDGERAPWLPLGDSQLPLGPLIGQALTVRFDGEIRCQNCDRKSKKSFSQGYCFPCFKKLARCDLCMVSPTRCHYDQGTCREPEWAQGFCFKPHSVYLANSSGLKVGITGRDREPVRWLDQGARQAQVLAWCETRQQAGELEAQLSEQLSDRTQWRKLVSEDAPDIDLAAAREAALAQLGELPAGVTVATAPEQRFSYPVASYGKTRSISLDKTAFFTDVLTGIKGQYLLFEEGVFNVRKHTGYRVHLSAQPAPAGEPQLEIF